MRRMSRTTRIASLLALLNLLFPQHAQILTAYAAQPEESQPILLQQVFPGVQVPAGRVGELPRAANKLAKKVFSVTMTAYSSSVDETDGDPFTAASGTKVHDGMIAYNFLPFGTKVRFPDRFGDKVFVIEDRMNARHGRYSTDIWMPSKDAAKQWGARVVRMEIL